MLEFSLLASGSRANSLYVSDGSTRILVDAGLSAREISRRLALLGIDPESLDAVVISHEHSDHIRGALQFARNCDVPIYANDRTFHAWMQEPETGIRTETFLNCSEFSIGSLSVRAYPSSHDAEDPVVFEIAGGGASIGVVTDLGIVDRAVEDGFSDVDALVIESNHDPLLLQDAPYPGALKRRISGRFGHLSNDQAVEFVRLKYGRRSKPLQALLAAHVSENSNHPEVVCEAFEQVLSQLPGTPWFAVGSPRTSTEIYTLWG